MVEYNFTAGMSEIAIREKMTGTERDRMGQNKIEQKQYWF